MRGRRLLVHRDNSPSYTELERIRMTRMLQSAHSVHLPIRAQHNRVPRALIKRKNRS